MTAVTFGIEAAGWIGAVLILLAYALLSGGKLTGHSLVYQGLNIIGAAGFALNGWWHDAKPSAVLNILWMLIGLGASIRILRRSERRA